jgi:putative ABC transport system ATP-binding protein
MLVTHDMKVAAKSDRIMYIEDGSIKGEFKLGKFTLENSIKERERKVNNWLMEMGW